MLLYTKMRDANTKKKTKSNKQGTFDVDIIQRIDSVKALKPTIPTEEDNQIKKVECALAMEEEKVSVPNVLF